MMTSSPIPPHHAFAFLHLPGETAPVVCGRFEQRGHGRDIIGLFTYGRSFLGRSNAVPIDPIGLPLIEGTAPPTAKLGGIHGALRDASPDAWGRRVIEYARGERAELTELEYLLAAGDDRTGALVFGVTPSAPASARHQHHAVSLPDLLHAAELLEADGPITPEAQHAAELLLHGVTMGGARPKAAIIDDDRMWLAKFPSMSDRVNLAAVEAGLLTLAERCGLRVPAHRTVRVGGKPVLLVERFDRSGSPSAPLRARYLSGLTLMDAEELPSRDWSYLRLAEELRRRSAAPDEDCRELFARAAFNALVSNGDDHPRNHAIIAWGRDDWRLSPLFDVVPTEPATSRERRLALIAGRYGRAATRANLVSEAAVFRMAPDEAHARIDDIQVTLRGEWENAMRQHGASAADLAATRHAIVPDGFEDASAAV
jgi:serine/threonine-protein kinase HipA